MTRLQAQELVISDAEWEGTYRSITEQTGGAQAPPTTARTQRVALSLPFFDDFAYDSLKPSAALWFASELDLRVPGISVQKGLNVPSKGVITLDGATFKGRKYSTELENGPADSLVSLGIDLSGLSPADSVYLSFFFQRGGAGEGPEASDSLVVQFDSTGNFDFEQVWSAYGTAGPESEFHLVMIPLREARFFNGNFHFKFMNYGSLNGEFDQWHLDYVVLDAGRTANDTVFSDVSLTRIETGPIYPYTSLPWDHYNLGVTHYGIAASLSNVSAPQATTGINATLSEVQNNTPLTGTITGSGGPLTLNVYAKSLLAATPFSDQASVITQPSVLRVSASLNPNGANIDNDRLSVDYRLDSVVGYDDGVSDFGYGLTSARSFCMEIRTKRKDTLEAVWINWTPSLHYNGTNNQSTCLDGKSFKLMVWDTLVPDSFIAQVSSGMNVKYDSSLNDFHRYALITPLEVDTLFWVGVLQADGMPIGIGFDRNTDGVVYYEAPNGDFVPSTNQGTLMMRPEFDSPGLVGRQEALLLEQSWFRVGPNPVRGRSLNLIQEEGSQLRNLRLSLSSLDGRHLQESHWDYPARQLVLEMPAGLAAGLYLLELEAVGLDGKLQRSTHRIMVAGE